MKYQTRDKLMHSKPEENSGESKVQSAGYIPRHKKIESLILAGKRLDQIRMGQFDVEEGSEVDIDDIDCDPTRSKAFDLADASMIAKSGENTIKNLREGLKVKKVVEKNDVPVKDDIKPEDDKKES